MDDNALEIQDANPKHEEVSKKYGDTLERVRNSVLSVLKSTSINASFTDLVKLIHGDSTDESDEEGIKARTYLPSKTETAADIKVETQHTNTINPQESTARKRRKKGKSDIPNLNEATCSGNESFQNNINCQNYNDIKPKKGKKQKKSEIKVDTCGSSTCGSSTCESETQEPSKSKKRKITQSMNKKREETRQTSTENDSLDDTTPKDEKQHVEPPSDTDIKHSIPESSKSNDNVDSTKKFKGSENDAVFPNNIKENKKKQKVTKVEESSENSESTCSQKQEIKENVKSTSLKTVARKKFSKRKWGEVSDSSEFDLDEKYKEIVKNTKQKSTIESFDEALKLRDSELEELSFEENVKKLSPIKEESEEEDDVKSENERKVKRKVNKKLVVVDNNKKDGISNVLKKVYEITDIKNLPDYKKISEILQNGIPDKMKGMAIDVKFWNTYANLANEMVICVLRGDWKNFTKFLMLLADAPKMYESFILKACILNFTYNPDSNPDMLRLFLKQCVPCVDEKEINETLTAMFHISEAKEEDS